MIINMKNIIISILLFSSLAAFGQNKTSKEKIIKLRLDYNSNGTVKRFHHKECKDSVYFIKEKDSVLINGNYQYGYRTRVLSKDEVKQRKLK